MASNTIIIDPVTRIEGHLRIETEIKANRVVNAKASADMFRGIEAALTGYDARVAQQVTQRVCGVCPYAHAEAAAKALEDAMKIKPNRNGQLLRNLITGAYQLQDYILHFYQLCSLDFIDIAAVLKYQGKDRDLVYIKDWIKAEQQSNRIYPTAPFLPRYDADYCRDDDINLSVIKHYAEAFNIMKDLHKMIAIFGAKAPHTVTIEAGGVTVTPTVSTLSKYLTLLNQAEHFIKNKYTNDLLAVAAEFKQYFKEGKGYGNLLAFSQLPGADGDNFTFTNGTIINGKFSKLNLDLISLDHTYSYYQKGTKKGIRPLTQKTPEPLNWKEFKKEHDSKNGKYSWARAPRYRGNAMEVGAVARLLTTYYSRTNSQLNQIVKQMNRKLGVTLSDYPSVMGRHLSRAIVANVVVDKLKSDIDQVTPGQLAFDNHEIPKNATGVGLTEGSRGALGHWIRTDEQGYISRYDLVVPTTWNISPRNADKKPGPLEKMLIDTKVRNQKQPIELARIVRSTDPCIACSVH